MSNRKSTTEVSRNREKLTQGRVMSATFEQVFRDFLSPYAEIRSGWKHVANIAEVSHRTVEGWWHDRRCPRDMDVLRRMKRNSPEFDAKFTAWLEGFED